jgi:hypothetical protein
VVWILVVRINGVADGFCLRREQGAGFSDANDPYESSKGDANSRHAANAGAWGARAMKKITCDRCGSGVSQNRGEQDALYATILEYRWEDYKLKKRYSVQVAVGNSPVPNVDDLCTSCIFAIVVACLQEQLNREAIAEANPGHKP